MEPEKFYHAYTHANGWENLFTSDENKKILFKSLQALHEILNDQETFIQKKEVIDWFGNREEFEKFTQNHIKRLFSI